MEGRRIIRSKKNNTTDSKHSSDSQHSSDNQHSSDSQHSSTSDKQDIQHSLASNNEENKQDKQDKQDSQIKELNKNDKEKVVRITKNKQYLIKFYKQDITQTEYTIRPKFKSQRQLQQKTR